MNRESRERAASAATQAATLVTELHLLAEAMRHDESISLEYLCAIVRERDKCGRLDSALRRRMQADSF